MVTRRLARDDEVRRGAMEHNSPVPVWMKTALGQAGRLMKKTFCGEMSLKGYEVNLDRILRAYVRKDLVESYIQELQKSTKKE